MLSGKSLPYICQGTILKEAQLTKVELFADKSTYVREF